MTTTESSIAHLNTHERMEIGAKLDTILVAVRVLYKSINDTILNVLLNKPNAGKDLQELIQGCIQIGRAGEDLEATIG